MDLLMLTINIIILSRVVCVCALARLSVCARACLCWLLLLNDLILWLNTTRISVFPLHRGSPACVPIQWLNTVDALGGEVGVRGFLKMQEGQRVAFSPLIVNDRTLHTQSRPRAVRLFIRPRREALSQPPKNTVPHISGFVVLLKLATKNGTRSWV